MYLEDEDQKLTELRIWNLENNPLSRTKFLTSIELTK